MIRWLIGIVAVVLAAGAPVQAQGPTPAGSIAKKSDKARAKAHFQRGQSLVKAGRYVDAYAAFEAGYKLSKRPLFLFNMAECARLAGDTPRAKRAYDHYLRADPNGKLAPRAREQRAALASRKVRGPEGRPEGRTVGIHKTEAPSTNARKVEENSPPPRGSEHLPSTNAHDKPMGHRASSEGATAALTNTSSIKDSSNKSRSFISAVEVGAGTFSLPTRAGVDAIVTPVVAVFRARVAYAKRFGLIEGEIGVSAELASMRYDGTGEGTIFLTTGMIHAGLSVRVHPLLQLRGDVGTGHLIISGLGDGNPLSADKMSTDAVTLPSVRIAAGMVYSVADQWAVSLTPVLTTSELGSELDDGIESMQRMALFFGINYRP